jgi:membrane protein YdbS with pleckstrin-like domain
MKQGTYRELNKALAQQALQEVRRTWAWKGIWLALGGAAAYRAFAQAVGPTAPLILAAGALIVLMVVVWLGLRALPFLIGEAGAAYVWARTLRGK